MHVHPFPHARIPYPGDVITARPLIFEANLLMQVIQEYGTHAEVDAVLASMRSKAAEVLARPRPTLDDIDNALGHAAE